VKLDELVTEMNCFAAWLMTTATTLLSALPILLAYSLFYVIVIY